MSESGEVLARPAGSRSLRRRSPAPPLLAEALADLSAAGTRGEVATAAAEHAVLLTGARAAAVGLLTRARTELELAGSVGYDCDSMGAGARLPLTAGLPITEAARTGAAVIRGAAGGGWVAVPLIADPANSFGALLVSLDRDSDEVAVDLLADLAGHVRRALLRCPAPASDDTPVTDDASPRSQPGPLRLVTGSPSTTVPPDAGRDAVEWELLTGLDIAVRIDPLLQRGRARSGIGGDVVEIVPDGRGGGWLVIADACGVDAVASGSATTTALLVRALGPHVDDPAVLLGELDRLLESERVARYVTALAMHVTPDAPGGAARVRFASAGHPLPLVTADAGSARDPRHTGLPLNLGLGVALGAETVELTLTTGDALLAFTDGVTDRRDRCLPHHIVDDVFHRAVGLFADASTALETVFDVLAGGQGAPGDDAAAVLLRVL